MFKTASALFVALFCVWCGSSAMDESPRRDSSPCPKLPRNIGVFGGELVGRNHGEFGGGLVFRDSTGQEQVLLPRNNRFRISTAREQVLLSRDDRNTLSFEGCGDANNVLGIGNNQHGVFVFTGLVHLGMSSGSVYQVHQAQSGELIVSCVTRLPGAPAKIQQHEDGSFRFVHEGHLRSNEPGRKHCMSFDGESVTESNDCGYAER